MSERTEHLVPGPAEALAGLLDLPLPDLYTAGLPPLWHWVYLLDRPPQSTLGPDGHPATGGLPSRPAPGLRRMFAGGRVTQHGPLLVPREATRRSAVVRQTDKQGSAGRLTFVTVAHEISQDGRVVVSEEQDIVYREPVDQPPPQGPRDPDDRDWFIAVDPVLLFRFSALTYNGHRIHYDRDFARAEGYPGLLVHGPLQALAMSEAARRLRPGLTRFAYRLVSPLFDEQGMAVRAEPSTEGIDTTVRDGTGRLTATGTAG